VLLYQGKIEEAELWYKRALDIMDEQPGPGPADAIMAGLNNLAVTLICLGKHEEAEAACRRVLGMLDKQSDSENLLELATARSNLGRVLSNRGEYAEAEFLYEGALSIRLKELGFMDPATRKSFDNLMRVCEAQGKVRNAEVPMGLLEAGSEHQVRADSKKASNWMLLSFCLSCE
jgi:tetratricopeptide (TPR) repeat protein